MRLLKRLVYDVRNIRGDGDRNWVLATYSDDDGTETTERITVEEAEAARRVADELFGRNVK